MQQRITRILFLFVTILILEAYGRKGQMPQRTRAYLDAFRNIPKLFDYLLETLDERPEILENNDAAVFKRDASQEDDATVSNEYIFKRDTGYNNDVTDSTTTESDENAYFDDASEDDINDNNIDYVENDNDDNDIEENNNGQSTLAYFGSEYDTFTTLTSDEVAENALKVEQMLEEHRSNK